MSTGGASKPPVLQRLYDRIWLIGLVAFVFWALSYIVWGLLDIYSVPGGP